MVVTTLPPTSCTTEDVKTHSTIVLKCRDKTPSAFYKSSEVMKTPSAFNKIQRLIRLSQPFYKRIGLSQPFTKG